MVIFIGHQRHDRKWTKQAKLGSGFDERPTVTDGDKGYTKTQLGFRHDQKYILKVFGPDSKCTFEV